MARRRAGGKSAAAFRTISEVADELDLPQHVLRFWETKFDAVQPLKRGGGRRYYRPEDIDLLRRIRNLLYDEGYAIKDVQDLFARGQVEIPTPSRHTVQAKHTGQRQNVRQAGDMGAAVKAGGSSTPAPRAGEQTPQELSGVQKRELEHVLADLRVARDRLRRAREPQSDGD